MFRKQIALGEQLLLIDVTPVGTSIVREAEYLIRECNEQLPATYQSLALTADFDCTLGSTLTRILNVRNEPAVLMNEHLLRRPEPTIAFVLAAAELLPGDLQRVLQAVQQVRRELQRSRLAGCVIALVYDGFVQGHLPSQALLQELDSLTEFDAVVGLSDTDQRGRRWSLEDVIAVAALFLRNLPVWEPVRHALRSPFVEPEMKRIGLGLAQLDTSSKALELSWCRKVRANLHQFVFAPPCPPDAGVADTVTVTMELVNSILARSGGAIAEVHRLLEPAARAAAASFECTQLRENAVQTHASLMSLLPPSLGPAPLRIPWWRKLTAVFRRRQRRSPEPVASTATVGEVTKSSPVLLQELTDTEHIRTALKSLELALAPEDDSARSIRPLPFRWHLGDQPEIVAAVALKLPDTKELAWQLFQDLTLEQLLEEPVDARRLRQWVDDACARALAETLIHPRQYADLARTAAATVAVLMASHGGVSEKFVSMIPDDAPYLTIPDHVHVDGTDDAITFVVLNRGIRFSQEHPGTGV